MPRDLTHVGKLESLHYSAVSQESKDGLLPACLVRPVGIGVAGKPSIIPAKTYRFRTCVAVALAFMLFRLDGPRVVDLFPANLKHGPRTRSRYPGQVGDE